MSKIIINKGNMFQFVSSFFELLKDKAVIYGMTNKIWIALSSAVTAPLIILLFSPSLQGYYYTFTSLLGIQTLVVMGLGQLLQQMVSHEWAKLKYNSEAGITGDSTAIFRLGAIKRFAVRWFTVMSFLLFVLLSIGGYIFIKSSGGLAVPMPVWVMPWIIICLLKSVQIFLSPGLSFLEGINEVESVNRFRFTQSLSERVTAWIIMLIGGQLWLFSAGTFVNLLGQLKYFNGKYSGLLKNVLRLKSGSNDIWKREILPLQWRYSLSSLAGYLNFSFIIPLIFWYLGAVAAGQAGITWAVISMFWGLSVTIISTKMPALAIDAAKKNFIAVNRLFLVSTLNSTLLLFLSVLSFYLLLLFFGVFFPSVALRFLEPVPALLLSLSIIPHHLKFAMVSYMRAMKKEPFWHLSVLESLLILILLPVILKNYSITGLASGFLIIIVLSCSITYFVFKKIRPAV